MATAVSISIRREAAMAELSANAAGIGDSFPDLPALDLTRKNKDNEIEQVSILERVADYLRLVQMRVITAENERVSEEKSFASHKPKRSGSNRR